MTSAVAEAVNDMKHEQKVKKMARLRLLKDRAEALKNGATMTRKEARKLKNASREAVEKVTRAVGKVLGGKKSTFPASLKKERSKEDRLLNKYPHMKKGTLRFDEKATKQTCTITCTLKLEGCKKTRDVYTSDLWQVKACSSCTQKARSQRKKEKK